jgi:hypothetical protein
MHVVDLLRRERNHIIKDKTFNFEHLKEEKIRITISFLYP